jgi:hypothetical protein
MRISTQTSSSIKEIAPALGKAQSAMKGARATSVNPFFNSKYADLESVNEALAPIYENGLSYSQLSSFDGQNHIICTLIMHTSGEWICSEFPIFGQNLSDPQKHKSAHTLLRRAALMAALGLAEIDDDGNTAVGFDQKDKGKKKEENNQQKKHVQDDISDHHQDAQNGAQYAKDGKKVTESQLKRLFAILKNSTWTEDSVKSYIKLNFNIETTRDLTMAQYDQICSLIESAKKL